MLAAQLDTEKYQVTLYDKKKAVGRKFLVAGEGGLNLTFNSNLEELITQYFPSKFMTPSLKQFTNEDLRNWFKSLEIPTFLGSSNRVFPAKELKPIDVLNKIVEHIKSKNVKFELGIQWTGWNTDGHLCFEDQENIESDITIFALGGASWKVTGSDGEWSKNFKKRGINVLPFRAANCAFHIDWDKNFIHTHAGKPLKNIALKYKKQTSKGELVVSEFGLEGNALYALSRSLQDELLTKKSVCLKVDLKPTMTMSQIKAKYKKSKLTKVTDILKEDLSLDRTAVALIKQYSDKETFMDIDQLAKIIKAVPITLTAADDIDKAISTLGGIALDEVDTNFQLNKMPNTYAIGEMLDWYAPTGGYLLQGCFSMGFSLAENLNGVNVD
jgi:uncharacterized flavoprotein (TIGR03862 family)